MQVLMKEKLLESNYFNNKTDSTVIRQALSVNNNMNNNGIISSSSNKQSSYNDKNTAKNTSKLVAFVASSVSANKEKEEKESIPNVSNVGMGMDDTYGASGESNSPISSKIDSLTNTTASAVVKQSKKSNLKKVSQKIDALEKDAEILIVTHTQTPSQKNTLNGPIQVYFEGDINNDESGDDANDLKENLSKDGLKMLSNGQNILVKHAGSKSSKVTSSNSNKVQLQQNQHVKSSKPKKVRKKDKLLNGTENAQTTNNDIDAYMQGKTVINSLVRSAINITNQYQAQIKSIENFSPQNSDLVSNSSSNLKTNENSSKKVDKSKEKDKKKKSKKSRKKKKSSSTENINLLNDSPNDQQIINIDEIESREAKIKETECANNSQSLSFKSKRTVSAKRQTNNSQTQIQNDNLINYSNNESLRWQNQLDNIDEEQKRIEMYKMNRRKRYIDQRNIQLLAALSKAKSVLSSINTPTNVKIEDLTLDHTNNNNNNTLATNHERPSSKLTSRNNHNMQNLIIEDLLNSSTTASKMNLNENSFRPISSRRKIANYSNMNGGNDTSIDYMELNSISTNMASTSLLPSRPKSEKSFRSSSFVLNNPRSLIGGETIISSITSNS